MRVRERERCGEEEGVGGGMKVKQFHCLACEGVKVTARLDRSDRSNRLPPGS